MFDHVKSGVGDFEASKALYLKALEPPGVVHGIEAVCHEPEAGGGKP